MEAGHNPKAIANLILHTANALGKRATNLSINKIAYFAHGSYLARYHKPLIDAKIEAWEFGPVFREIYHEFKRYGDRNITALARDLDPDTGEFEVSHWQLVPEEEEFLKGVISSYLNMRAAYLVDLSHIQDGPWYEAWNHDGRINPGMEISNEAILQYFSREVRH